MPCYSPLPYKRKHCADFGHRTYVNKAPEANSIDVAVPPITLASLTLLNGQHQFTLIKQTQRSVVYAGARRQLSQSQLIAKARNIGEIEMLAS
jgi:hypothetical protein